MTFSLSAPLEDWTDAQRLARFPSPSDREHRPDPGGRRGSGGRVDLPFTGGQSSSSFGTVDNSEAESDAWSLENKVSPGYFETMGVPLLRGRLFERSDTADSQTGGRIINERLASEYWAESKTRSAS